MKHIQRKISYDEERLMIVCGRSFGVSSWSAVLKKVPLTEIDELTDEVAALREEVTFLRKEVARLSEKKGLRGIVKMYYKDCRLQYECDPELDHHLLVYFKDGIVESLYFKQWPEKRTFLKKVLNADNFDSLQNLVMDSVFIEGNELVRFNYFPYGTTSGRQRAYDQLRFWERGSGNDSDFICGSIARVFYGSIPEDGLVVIAEFKFPFLCFTIDQQPPEDLRYQLVKRSNVYCDSFGNIFTEYSSNNYPKHIERLYAFE